MLTPLPRHPLVPEEARSRNRWKFTDPGHRTVEHFSMYSPESDMYDQVDSSLREKAGLMNWNASLQAMEAADAKPG